MPDEHGLGISKDAYHPAQYYAENASNVFRDIRGPGADQPQALVRIQAHGVEIDGASHTHFIVEPNGSAPDPAWDCYDRDDYPAVDPPVKLLNIDLGTCTYSPDPLPPGTILNGELQK